MDYAKLFYDMFPGYFDQEYIRALPPEDVSAEQVLFLDRFEHDLKPIPCPDSVRFDFYRGDTGPLVKAVGLVDEGWIKYYESPGKQPVFCAFDKDKVVSFCILDDMGDHLGFHIGGPGCVGTIPEYRRQGIGLEMIRRATKYFKDNGFGISFIHYTHVDKWYAKLGYETVVRWNRNGIVWTKPDQEA